MSENAVATAGLQVSDDARREALAKAMAARKTRAEAKAALKAKEMTLSEFLAKADEDESLSRCKVADVLKSLPGIGAHRAAKIMETCGISENRRIKGFGARQRERVLAIVEPQE